MGCREFNSRFSKNYTNILQIPDVNGVIHANILIDCKIAILFRNLVRCLYHQLFGYKRCYGDSEIMLPENMANVFWQLMVDYSLNVSVIS